jgi:hypothetical protein
MLRRCVILVSLFACLTTDVSASSSIAYVDLGKDPQEGVALDIRSSRRWVRHTEEGRRLVVTVRLYDVAPFNSFSYKVFLDSRGANRADFYVFTDNTSGLDICKLKKYGGGNNQLVSHCLVRYEFFGAEVVRIRVAARDVRPDKHIRWRVYAPPLVDETSDRAPDQGFYA